MKQSKRLSTKMVIWFASMMIGLLVLLCTVIGLYTSKKMQSEIGHSLADTAFQVSNHLDQYMWSRAHEIEILSALDAVRSGQDYAQVTQVLNQLHTSFPSFAWIGLTDSRGIVRASTNDVLRGTSVATRPVFTQGSKEHFIGDVHDAVLLSKLLPNPSGEPMKFVDISCPLHNAAGEFTGVLAAHLDWSWAEDTVSSIAQSLPNRQNIDIYVMSSDKTVLLGPSNDIGSSLVHLSFPDYMSSQPQWGTEIWPDSKRYLTGAVHSSGYRDYSGLGWTVLVRQPIMIAYADVFQMQFLIVLLGLIFTVIFIILGGVISRGITMPLNELSHAASRLWQGDRISLPKHTGIREIELLEHALSNLLAGLTTTEIALDKMEERALTDPLTGLPNRAAFYTYLTEHLSHPHDESDTLTLLYVDLDGFKAVNDTFGHHAGDELLMQLSARLKNCVRCGAMVARLGGDEFIISLPSRSGSDIKAARDISTRIIAAATQPFTLEQDKAQIGCSIGCSIWPTDGSDLTQIVQQADQALYYSKCKGKNRLTFYRDIKPRNR